MIMKEQFLSLLALLGAIVLLAGCSGAKSASAGQTKMRLVWSDEFNRPGLPDSTKWGYDAGDGCPNICGWGNNELQYYTVNRAENAWVENGFLVIEARREKMGTREYSSARMVSKHKGDWTYGPAPEYRRRRKLGRKNGRGYEHLATKNADRLCAGVSEMISPWPWEAPFLLYITYLPNLCPLFLPRACHLVKTRPLYGRITRYKIPPVERTGLYEMTNARGEKKGM